MKRGVRDASVCFQIVGGGGQSEQGRSRRTLTPPKRRGVSCPVAYLCRNTWRVVGRAQHTSTCSQLIHYAHNASPTIKHDLAIVKIILSFYLLFFFPKLFPAYFIIWFLSPFLNDDKGRSLSLAMP